MELEQLNDEQKAFYQFIMQRIQKGKEAEAEAIAAEAFARQQAGTFTKEYLSDAGMRIIALLRFECISEFLQSAKDFQKKFL